MRYIKILAIILAIGITCWGDISISVIQNGDSARVSLEPVGIGAYVRIIGCGESVLQQGVFDTSAVMNFAIPTCGSLYVVWTPITTITPADVVPMAEYKVLIPGAWFRIGADVGDSMALVNGGADASFIREARPDRWVYVDTFIIRTIEEPCSLFAQFIADGGYEDTSLWKLSQWEIDNPADSMVGWQYRDSVGLDGTDIVCESGRYPVRRVSFYEALAYSHWEFGTLPTEAQWEVAARLNTGTIFPWGDVFCIPDYNLTANVSEGIQCDDDPFTGGPGYPEFFAGDSSAAGCYSMGGNISEWCLDGYESNFYGMLDPLAPFFTGQSDENRAIRGGNFNTGYRYRASVFERSSFSPTSRQSHIGFRVAWCNSNGNPDEWFQEVFIFDQIGPETLAVIVPHGCLMDWVVDSFAIIFSEPVSGNISITPDMPSNIYPRWNNYPGETLWVIKQPVDLTGYDSVCVDISLLQDTVGNSLEITSPVCVPICGTCLEINQVPETLWAPQQCYTQGEIQIINCSDISLTVDSVLTYSPFEIYDDVINIAPDETVSLTVRFTPDCSGRISMPIVLYGNFGLYSDSLLGYGCDEPLAVAQPPALDFGETCDSMCLNINIFLNGCTAGMFEICDIFWMDGVNFNLYDITLGDTLTDSLTGTVCFDSLEKGENLDTLYIRFRPMGGVCCESATISIPVRATCFGTGCEPHTNVKAVLADGNNTVLFSCIDKDVTIFDRKGRFVRKLEPDKYGDVEWDLKDDNQNVVPAGVYYWISADTHDKIIVIR
ncbi:hypothetical protein DRQ33_02970 [bacterium]|nr:MAG: hypothetical protein DRQ33_02970 [bacterium]